MVVYWGSGFVLDAWRQHGDETRWNQIAAAAASQGPRASFLARPVEDTLFFAGEATDTEGRTGTVEGALATGRRAGQAAVRALG